MLWTHSSGFFLCCAGFNGMGHQLGKFDLGRKGWVLVMSNCPRRQTWVEGQSRAHKTGITEACKQQVTGALRAEGTSAWKWEAFEESPLQQTYPRRAISLLAMQEQSSHSRARKCTALSVALPFKEAGLLITLIYSQMLPQKMFTTRIVMFSEALTRPVPFCK